MRQYLMTCYELATIAEYNIPVKVAILNNDFQGMVKQWQDLFYQRRYSQTRDEEPQLRQDGRSLRHPRHPLRAQERRARRPSRKCSPTRARCVVDFCVEPNEHVYPMVPSGKGLHEMEMGTLA